MRQFWSSPPRLEKSCCPVVSLAWTTRWHKSACFCVWLHVNLRNAMFSEVSAQLYLKQIWLAARTPGGTNFVPFRNPSQLYFLNMLMICQSLWLLHTAGPKRPGSWWETYKLLLFETFSTSHLSPQRCSDGARPEVIFHSLMLSVEGSKGGFYSSVNILYPLWYGIHYKCLVVQLLT